MLFQCEQFREKTSTLSEYPEACFTCDSTHLHAACGAALLASRSSSRGLRWLELVAVGCCWPFILPSALQQLGVFCNTSASCSYG